MWTLSTSRDPLRFSFISRQIRYGSRVHLAVVPGGVAESV
jgi:hypothetical protein